MSLIPQDLEQIVRETASETLRDVLFNIIQKLNAVDDRVDPLTESTGILANAPTLAAGDAGFIYNITDYMHRVRWDGSVWQWAPGDNGNRYFGHFEAAPGDGWQLCDGSTAAYVVIGAASLTTANFVTPNITGNPSYPKLGAAYAGIAAAVAPGVSGSTAGATATVSGSTASESAHTHAVDPPSTGVTGSTANESTHTHPGGTVSGNTASSNTTFNAKTVDADLLAATLVVVGQVNGIDPTVVDGHLHGVGTLAVGTSGAGSAHGHGAGTLAVDIGSFTSGAGSAHLHGAGTLAVDSHLHGAGTLAVDATAEPRRVTLLPYYRKLVDNATLLAWNGDVSLGLEARTRRHRWDSCGESAGFGGVAVA